MQSSTQFPVWYPLRLVARTHPCRSEQQMYGMVGGQKYFPQTSVFYHARPSASIRPAGFPAPRTSKKLLETQENLMHFAAGCRERQAGKRHRNTPTGYFALSNFSRWEIKTRRNIPPRSLIASFGRHRGPPPRGFPPPAAPPDSGLPPLAPPGSSRPVLPP